MEGATEFCYYSGITIFLVGLIVGRWSRAFFEITAEGARVPGGGASTGGRTSLRSPLASVSFGAIQVELSESEGEEIRHLLSQGNKIAAIKRLREIKGLELNEAKGVIDTLSR